MELGALIILGAVFLAREWMNAREKHDLMDRLMSKDFQDYKRHVGGKKRHTMPANMTDEEMARKAGEPHEV